MWSVGSLVSAVCFIFLAGTSSCFCADLFIPPQVAGPGASVLIAVSFASHGEYVSGLQFDLTLDSSALSLSTTIGGSARSSGKTLYFGAKSLQQSRFLIAGFSLSPISDGAIANLFIDVSPEVAPGVYSIRFASVVASDPSGHAVDVSASDGSITIQPIHGAAVSLEGVLNGASLLPGPVAPGEIITIMGAAIGPPAAAGTKSITFDGVPAPLLYVGPNQINAVVPFGVDGRSTTALQIASLQGGSTQISVSVAPSAPAVFTIYGGGTGQGAILNQDGTLNSPVNPAQSGSIVSLFATGAGQTAPPGIDGLITAGILFKPLLPISVSIGGASAGILYAGAAPGLISGVLQVNCRVPMTIEPGPSVPLILIVGDSAGPPVTLAVK